MKKPVKTTSAAKLRQRAEKELQKQNSSTAGPLSPHEAQRLLHELQIHHIELELQNDELRHAKKELEASQERFIDLYDLAPVGYCVVSEEGLILEANLTAANLLGTSRASLIGQPILRFILKKDQEIYNRFNSKIFINGDPQSCELRLVRQGATSFWAHLESTLAQDESGIPVSHLVLSDISDRKQIEEAFREVHRQNQEILESSTDAFIALTDDMVVSYVNTAAERMFNLQRINVIGKKFFDVFPEGKGTRFETQFSQAIQKKSAMSFQTELTVAPFQNWYEARIYPKSDGITVCVQVITERLRKKEKKAERASLDRQHQKAKSLGRMAGAIAHHFNNKLFVVMGSLDLAIEGEISEDIVQKNLLLARKAAGEAAEVSKLMLTYLGQVTGRLQLLDLSDICRKMLPILEATLPETVVIKTQLASPGPIIKANADQIRQILENLVANAMEAFGNDPGTVFLTVNRVNPEDIPSRYRFPIEWKPGNTPYACLKIQDEGCGITKQDIEEIFSPFFSTKFTGRGIGLSVVLGLVRARGGVVTVESSPGDGSVFGVYFPVDAKEAELQASKIENEPIGMGSGLVLLVDDDKIVLELSNSMLSALGFTVLTAMDGIEALDLFRQHKDEISLVISDVAMPRMDGWETLSELKKISPDIPVIFASGYSMEQVMQGDRSERPQAFLGKPYNMQMLKDTIRRVMDESDKR